jgi:dolichyl-phosphate-mannose--protein O-mannosyl transferase
VYFAYFYSVAGDIYSEVFRFINVPFFLGTLILSYKIFRQYFSNKSSLLGVIIFVSFPLIEDLVFQVGLYPDFIFLFLTSLVFYLLEKLYRDSSERITLNYLILGGALALSLLFKYQAILLYAIVFSIVVSNFYRKIGSIMSLLIALIPTSILLIQGGPKAFRVWKLCRTSTSSNFGIC